MLRHVVFVKFKAGVTAEQVEEVKKALGGLPGKIREIQGLGLRSRRSPDGALRRLRPRGRFRGVEALKRYQVHPDHVPSWAGALRERVLQVADFTCRKNSRICLCTANTNQPVFSGRRR
jgi:hypothetical protein